LLIGGAIWVGHGQPPSDWAALLRLDDCQLPCWLGVVPGTTGLDEGERRVRLAYADDPDFTLEYFGNGQFAVTDRRSQFRIGVTLDTGDLAGERYTVPPTIQQIILWADVVPSKRVDFFDVYSSLGTPEELQTTSIGGVPYLMLFYHHQQVGLATIALICNAVSPAQKIYQIIISARTIPDYFGWTPTPARWLGFRRCHDLPPPFAP
jgi:hypothetical protein